jgi:hypothetical protein
MKSKNKKMRVSRSPWLAMATVNAEWETYACLCAVVVDEHYCMQQKQTELRRNQESHEAAVQDLLPFTCKLVITRSAVRLPDMQVCNICGD